MRAQLNWSVISTGPAPSKAVHVTRSAQCWRRLWCDKDQSVTARRAEAETGN